MPHNLRVSTLKDVIIHWIPRITFSFITWQVVDVKHVQFRNSRSSLFRRHCSPWPGPDVEQGRLRFTQGCFHARMPTSRPI